MLFPVAMHDWCAMPSHISGDMELRLIRFSLVAIGNKYIREEAGTAYKSGLDSRLLFLFRWEAVFAYDRLSIW